jgi:hypothetical protein
MSKNNKSGYKRVIKEYGKWRADIGIHGKQKFLGYYDKIEDAAQKYNEAALKYYGEFAYLNEVKNG